MAPDEFAQLLQRWSTGDEAALAALVPVVYDELRMIARSALRRERTDHTLQTTALVNEAFVRLLDGGRVRVDNRAHFFGIAARLMRQILVDSARSRAAAKRGAASERVILDEALHLDADSGVDVLTLHEALEALMRHDEQQARIVELRFFGGLTVEETAAVMALSPATVKRDWAFARAWLRRYLGEGGRSV